jgi:DNA modification methylase
MLGQIEVLRGSCLDLLPKLKANSFSGLITSPPYCNRYDYTRTYALELAMLDVGEDGIRSIRQTMLSCTVENKVKTDLRDKFGMKTFDAASAAFQSQRVLSLILEYLDECKKDETINNPGIVRMVRNYFFELFLLIFASAKILKPGAPFIMVNDNVRYQGAHVPVDLILSDAAEQAGFEVEAIWVLPRGKGNSSQQMGLHGREEIRKCIYVWRKK